MKNLMTYKEFNDKVDERADSLESSVAVLKDMDGWDLDEDDNEDFINQAIRIDFRPENQEYINQAYGDYLVDNKDEFRDEVLTHEMKFNDFYSHKAIKNLIASDEDTEISFDRALIPLNSLLGTNFQNQDDVNTLFGKENGTSIVATAAVARDEALKKLEKKLAYKESQGEPSND